MDRIDLRIRAQKMCKFFSELMTKHPSVCYNRGGGKQLVLIVEEIRT